MLKSLRKSFDENPLPVILIAAAFFRLLAAIFSRGYGMHDDHFLVIEAAQSWVDGADYNDWLPSASNPEIKASGHSLFYPGLHYLLFSVLEFFGMFNPQAKMFVVRLLHGISSLFIVYLGYKIALREAGIKAAKISGGLLAILFFMPMMSVRNLVEYTCILPLLLATWLVIKNSQSKKVLPFVLAGVLLSMAFSIRFQTALFVGGFMFALLIQKQWRIFFFSGVGLVLGLLVIQAATDILIWGRPFVELEEYVRYNIENAETYMTQRWYTYLLLIGGILIPPISLFLVFGFLRSWKRYLLIFLPVFIFFVFHSAFPNKQERFILPVIPFIIILGSIGWVGFMEHSGFWKRNLKLYRASWIFFFALNTIPLFFVSVAYSHRNRVESMVWLSEMPDLNNVLIEESIHDDYTLPPRFYLRKWKSDYFVTKIFTVDSLAERLRNSPPELVPNYVVFNLPDDLDERVANLKRIFPNMTYETTIEAGFIDKVMTFLNKHNANFTSYIYKLGEPEIKNKYYSTHNLIGTELND